jgi:hypothetical protein
MSAVDRMLNNKYKIARNCLVLVDTYSDLSEVKTNITQIWMK